jgi:hypothetical protein
MLSEEQLYELLLKAEDFLEPNDDTIEAMKECEYMLEHPEECKSYTNVQEMFEDILNERN